MNKEKFKKYCKNINIEITMNYMINYINIMSY